MENLQLTDREITVYLIVFFTILLLSLLQTTFDNELVPLNYTYAQIVNETGSLKRENALLYETLLRRKSLTWLYGESVRMEFVPARYIYLMNSR